MGEETKEFQKKQGKEGQGKSHIGQFVNLAAQCEVPPPYRAIPFRDGIAEGGISRVFPCFHRFSRKHR